MKIAALLFLLLMGSCAFIAHEEYKSHAIVSPEDQCWKEGGKPVIKDGEYFNCYPFDTN